MFRLITWSLFSCLFLLGCSQTGGTEPVKDEIPLEGSADGIGEKSAKEIAIAKVPGTVTDISVETKYGKMAYAVEIETPDGKEMDVAIDVATGEVLGIES